MEMPSGATLQLLLLLLVAAAVARKVLKWVPQVMGWGGRVLVRLAQTAATLQRLEHLSERMLENSDRTITAVVNLERRAMSQNMSGAECGRMLVGILEELNPHGAVNTWRQLHSRRKILELQAVWKRSCRPTEVP